MKTVKTLAVTRRMVCCLCLFICNLCYGQQLLSIQNVRKILISNSSGSFDGGITVNLEVLPGHGRWSSYQTSYQVTEGVKMDSAKSSFTRKLVTNVPATIVATFLKGLSIIKPQFRWQSFGISPAVLKSDLQLANPKAAGTPDFDRLVTDTTIANALLALHKPGGFNDFGIHCFIHIITDKGAVIAMDTRHYEVGLLPWTLDHHETYDIAITNFFTAAMGKENYANRYSFKDYKELVWEKLEESEPLSQYRWKYGYTKNMAMLKRNFRIDKVTFTPGLLPVLRSAVWCDLKSDELPFKTLIQARVDIADTGNIAQLIAFKQMAIRLEKSKSFLFSFCRNKPNAQLILSVPEKTTAAYIIRKGPSVMQSIPGINKAIMDKMVALRIHTPDGDSDWNILPDGRAILTYISANAAVSSVPASLKNIDLAAFNATKHFAIFDATGKQLE